MSEISAANLPLAGEQAILARRYVGALYALAEQEGAVDAVAADLLNLRVLWSESPEWRFVACDPRLSHESVAKAAEQVARSAGFGKLTSNFLAVVAENRRLSLLPLLIEYFFDEVGGRRGEFHADVRIARPLTETQREALTASLVSAVGGKVHLKVVEDASIIGGLTVKIGSQFLDASVKTKLDHLERSLKEAGAAA